MARKRADDARAGPSQGDNDADGGDADAEFEKSKNVFLSDPRGQDFMDAHMERVAALAAERVVASVAKNHQVRCCTPQLDDPLLEPFVGDI